MYCHYHFENRKTRAKRRNSPTEPNHLTLPHRYTCKRCGKSFSHPISLKGHLDTYHTEYFDYTTEGNYQCRLCEQRGRNKQAILKHINQQHLHVTTLLCDMCGKNFMSEKGLKAHIGTHSEERNYMCQICPKAFKDATTLRVHVRSHRDERRFVCDECGKAFKKSYSLTEHKKLHRGLLPFRCNICLKRFVSQTVLNSHVRRHAMQILTTMPR